MINYWITYTNNDGFPDVDLIAAENVVDAANLLVKIKNLKSNKQIRHIIRS